MPRGGFDRARIDDDQPCIYIHTCPTSSPYTCPTCSSMIILAPYKSQVSLPVVTAYLHRPSRLTYCTYTGGARLNRSRPYPQQPQNPEVYPVMTEIRARAPAGTDKRLNCALWSSGRAHPLAPSLCPIPLPSPIHPSSPTVPPCTSR